MFRFRFRLNQMQFKVLNDPIHGHVMLDKFQLQVIDTPQFQRLRDLKQLGACYYVFPGASHNRFEHSIGVSYLANQLVTRLQSSQPELEISESDVCCVTLAGLCHDLGHGPFSHVFDNEFIPRARPDIKWSHEKASEDMLDYMIEESEELQQTLETKDIEFIKDLIAGQPRSKESKMRSAFLFDIVANKRNGVDVDKFDYIQRDCYNIGTKSSYDCSRLLLFSRVIDNQLCYSHKEIFNVYEMFHTRYSLFKRVYSHKVSKARELMIIDAMLKADPVLNISNAIDDPKQYLHLTDNIIWEIQKSTSSELREAREIIKRMQKRYLYKFVEEYLIPVELRQYLNKSSLTPQIIVQFKESDSRITEQDIIIDWQKINYGMSNKNPIDYIKFYGKWNINDAFTIPRDKVSYIVPESYEEISIRIFARDPSLVPDIQMAFRRCMKSLTKSFVGQMNSNNSSPATNHQLLQLGDCCDSSAQVSPSKSVKEFEENPLETFPSKQEWDGIVRERGYSPNPKLTAKKNSQKQQKLNKNLLNELEDL